MIKTMHTLISFLGRTPKGNNGYRSTTYRFPDNLQETYAFFGYGLLKKENPDRLVVLGTAGSMWDHLFEKDVVLSDELETERLALIEAVDKKLVTQAQLDLLAPSLKAAFGCEVILEIIPYAYTPDEQFSLLAQLAKVFGDAGKISLDVTHAFRHLPMLALFATQYLSILKPRLNFAHIWYGAYDQDTGDAPVYDLAPLLVISKSTQAFAQFDATGNYGVFAELLNKLNRPTLAEQMEKASFLEQVQSGTQAKKILKNITTELRQSSLQGPGLLFQSALLERIDWANQDNIYSRQKAIAMQQLTYGDYLRAALFGFEAFITKQVKIFSPQGNPQDYELRQKSKDFYELSGKTKEYKILRDIRNQLAHGTPSKIAEVQKATSTEENLQAELKRIFSILLTD